MRFRLDRLKDPRAIETIRRAADAFNWQPRPARASPTRLAPGRAGFAYARYKQNENYVAMAIEVAVTQTPARLTSGVVSTTAG